MRSSGGSGTQAASASTAERRAVVEAWVAAHLEISSVKAPAAPYCMRYRCDARSRGQGCAGMVLCACVCACIAASAAMPPEVCLTVVIRGWAVQSNMHPRC
jgi:hypothetical protein